MGHGHPHGTNDIGSFTAKDQIALKSIIVASGDFNKKRYNDAFERLSPMNALNVEVRLARPAPDAQITYNKPGSGTFAAPKGIAVIDCRSCTLNGFKAQSDAPFHIKNSLYCGGEAGKSNKDLFDNAFMTFQQAMITTQQVQQILFYDNSGQKRAPEMCLRYIDFLQTNPNLDIKNLLDKQIV